METIQIEKLKKLKVTLKPPTLSPSLVHYSHGFNTLPDSDTGTDLDLDSKPDHYIVVCRKG